MLDSTPNLLLGLLTGFAFGFLLQKAAVTKFEVIVRQFLLRDFTMLRVMLTAIVVGGFGVYALVQLGLAELNVKPALLGAVAIGGAIFGAGMAVLGYCPGTGIAAMAEGSRHAAVGVLGMLFGAAAYSEAYGYLSASVLTWADYGKATLPALLGVSPWIVLVIVGLAAVTLFSLLARRARLEPVAFFSRTVNVTIHTRTR
jgi:uncharacterized membrane protein YedE/YeeE